MGRPKLNLRHPHLQSNTADHSAVMVSVLEQEVCLLKGDMKGVDLCGFFHGFTLGNSVSGTVNTKMLAVHLQGQLIIAELLSLINM
jgi:hypothetical protein